VDYALMFIPNEQVFCFLQENDNAIMNDSLKDRVILCSPMTLFALLCVMREAVRNFNVEKTAGDILRLLDNFDKQWGLYKDSMDKMGKKIHEAGEEYDKMSTTRTNQLERPLRKIEDLKRQQGLPASTIQSGKDSDEHGSADVIDR
jgi:DNA recombination protein RmuC